MAVCFDCHLILHSKSCRFPHHHPHWKLHPVSRQRFHLMQNMGSDRRGQSYLNKYVVSDNKFTTSFWVKAQFSDVQTSQIVKFLKVQFWWSTFYKIKFWVYYSEIFSGFSGPQVKCRISTMAWLPPASSTLLSLSSSHTGLLPMGPPRPKAFLPRGYLLHLDQSHPKLLPGCHLFTFQVCQTNCPLFPQTRSC